MPSRQRTRQLELVKRGHCSKCGRRPLLSTTLCAVCLKKGRVSARERKGYKAWRPGGPGGGRLIKEETDA